MVHLDVEEQSTSQDEEDDCVAQDTEDVRGDHYVDRVDQVDPYAVADLVEVAVHGACVIDEGAEVVDAVVEAGAAHGNTDTALVVAADREDTEMAEHG